MKQYGKYLCKTLLVCMGILMLLMVKPVNAQAATLKISKVSVSAPKTGTTYASGSITYRTSSYKNLQIRIRVLNSKGKYVYQRTLTGLSKSGTKTITWDGKASSGNAAKATANKIVPNGTYKLEVRLSGKRGKKTYTTTKKASFKISRTAATTTTTNTNATTNTTTNTTTGTASTDVVTTGTPRLTGDAELDYMAEMMLQEAGVTDTMTAEEKVKTIYYWVSHEFKHVHDSYSNYAKHYDLKALASKISEYKKQTDKLVAEKKASYVKLAFCSSVKLSSSAYTDKLQTTYQNTAKLWFNTRVGQCNRTADAFLILCNHAGIETGTCTGYYLNSNGTKSGHYWNWVRLGTEVYYYDVDVQLQNNAKGFKYPYYERWYKANLTMAKKHHEFTYSSLK